MQQLHKLNEHIFYRDRIRFKFYENRLFMRNASYSESEIQFIIYILFSSIASHHCEYKLQYEIKRQIFSHTATSLTNNEFVEICFLLTSCSKSD